MYESKKNSGRKDIYKYQKSSHQKNFHNSTYFPHYKYNKYKRKYSHSNFIKYDNEELIFSQIFDKKESFQNNNLKELDEIIQTPIIKNCKTVNENKENISVNSNINEFNTQMKTNDINDINDISESKNIEINENISFFIDNSSFNNFSEKIIFSKNFDKKENEKKDEFIKDINNLTNLNNINFSINENTNTINYNLENVINNLLLKNKECIINSNEKKNIHLEYKKNVFKTPQSFKGNSYFATNDMKEPFYVPKKLNSLNDINPIQQQTNIFEKNYNSLNNFSTLQHSSISLPNKQITTYNLDIRNNLNLNYFKNNNNFNKKFLSFNGNNNLNINNSFNISSSNNLPINSFNVESKNIPNINNLGNLGHINNLESLGKCLNFNNNSQHNLNKNPFHNILPKFELNKCILKTQINNNNLLEKDKENTDILEINVKTSKKEILTFKIRRYDDMFRTVKIFCEINKLDLKLIRPFIIYIIRALNSIYGIYNLNLKDEEIKFIKDIKKYFYNDEEENIDIKNISDKDKENNKIKNEDNLNNIICDSEDKKDYINSEVKENSIDNNDSFN